MQAQLLRFPLFVVMLRILEFDAMTTLQLLLIGVRERCCGCTGTIRGVK
jgi:hypothetical protein